MPRSIAVAVIIVFCFPSAAFAYVGPGLGLGAIGAALGILVAIALMVFGLVWDPLKRLMRKGRAAKDDKADIAGPEHDAE
jgi:peptidoglycan/LPS O-acetylase OafA/YrhL